MERDLRRLLGAAPGQDSTPAPGRRPGWAPARLAAALALAAAAVFVLWTVGWRQPALALEMEAALYRRAATGADERLRDGAVVHPGDQLFLEIDSSQPVHVYVLDEDEAGQAFVLFPLPELAQHNPLGAGRHRLPGLLGGREFFGDVTTAGGEESVLLVASVQSLPGLEQALAGIPTAAAGRPVQIGSAQVAGTLRGLGGLSPAPQAASGKLSFLFAELSSRQGIGAEAAFWQLRLQSAPRPAAGP
jgi:hypothetical protein